MRELSILISPKDSAWLLVLLINQNVGACQTSFPFGRAEPIPSIK